MAGQRLAHLGAGEVTVHREAGHVQRVQREQVVVHQRIIERRKRAVVAEVAPGQGGIAGEPAGVVVQALPRRAVGGRAGLAAGGEAAAPLAFGTAGHGGRQVHQQPVEEIHPRQIDRHLTVRLVHVVAAAGHVEVVAHQHQRPGACRQVAPGQRGAQVVGELHTRVGQTAGGKAGRHGFAIAPGVAPDLHRLDSNRSSRRPTPPAHRRRRHA